MLDLLVDSYLNHPRQPASIMPLAEEIPFSHAEVIELQSSVESLLLTFRQFITAVDQDRVDPHLVQEIPKHEEQLQNLIDSYSLIYDLIPEWLFIQQMDQMLAFRDVFLRLLQCHEAELLREMISESQGDTATSRPLFGSLGYEGGPRGGIRLAIPLELVASLIHDVGLTNEEISSILGGYGSWLSMY